MLINGYDINNLGVKLYDRIISSNEVVTSQDWLDGDFQPTFVRQQDKFKTMKLQFLILENDETAAYKVISKLTSLLKKGTIVFDDLDLTFDVSLNGKATQERIKNGKFIATFNLMSDYAQGKEEIFTTDKSATENFTLNIMYYLNTNTLIASERQVIRRADFKETGNTFESIGVNLNKYKQDHYQNGNPTNFVGIELTYDNLSKMPALIVNYAPVVYTIEVQHYKINPDSIYDLTAIVKTTFTYPKLLEIQSIGELIDLKSHKPQGYIARVMYDGPLTVESLLENSPISVYYDKPTVDRQKEVLITYKKEIGENNSSVIGSKTVLVYESDIVQGTRLKEIVEKDAYKPSKYYLSGVINNEDLESFVTFDSIKTNYEVVYNRSENTIYVEYYKGTSPDWFKVSTLTIKSKVEERFLDAGYKIDLQNDIGIEKDAFLTEVYNSGVIVNEDIIYSYDDLINLGVVQIYYVPKEYNIQVKYYLDDMSGEPIALETVTINDTLFLSGNVAIGDIIELNKHKPQEGYILYDYYQGEMSLSAILRAAPLNVVYGPIVAEPEKNITIKYKQQMTSTYSVIATDTITVKQSQLAGGVRLSQIIQLNKYIPQHYADGIIDGYSSNTVVEFKDLNPSYSVLYLAKNYQTNIRYYTDEVNDLNWIGSDVITYKIIDFNVNTTLFDLGLNLNLYKPAYCSDGELLYTGPVSFEALIQLESINVKYTSISEPEDPNDVKYPKRFLYLDFNDLKGNESLFPNETFNKAYINTGFTAVDMSKVTVVIETEKAWSNTDLTECNAGTSYLFGAKGKVGEGAFGMSFTNNSKYLVPGQNIEPNTYSAISGTRPITLDEEAAIGFSRNSGIYSTERLGYSFATFTYTNSIATDNSPIRYPIYLFANNNQGQYADGIAGVGIYGCKIYYNNEIMRDFVPVAFFDKIGDKVAPSNCLYDKISQTFFEDARGKNSFKIKDDPEWIPDLEFQLGSCFVNYYKGSTLFKTATIWFRGEDFKNPWDLRENLFVDHYQPQYHGPGRILEEESIGEPTFDKMKNKTLNVVYDSLGYNIEVNYYKDSISESNKLAADKISLTESDFYNNPTFGDLIEINKHKPDNYITDFKYTGKVVLSQITANSPYNIVYKPAQNITNHKTKIKYFERIKGENRNLGEQELVIDSTQFQEGVYIENFIVFDAKKPLYSESGTPLDFYLKDEMLISSSSLRESYSIIYEAAPQNIELRYYTDVADEDNQIASKNWAIKKTQWLETEPINLQEAIPYSLVNIYKPEICMAGAVQGDLITFADLVTKGYVDIIYLTIKEPTDPEGTNFPRKVIYFTNEDSLSRPEELPILTGKSPVNARRPWIDTGYKPKDISRLTMEVTTYALGEGVESNVSANTYTSQDYSQYIGYYGALPEKSWEQYSIGYMASIAGGKFPKVGNSTLLNGNSIGSTGCLSVKAHTPHATGYVYTCKGPQSIDGYTYMTPGNVAIGEGGNENKTSLVGSWRKGLINQNMDSYFNDKATKESVEVINKIKYTAKKVTGGPAQSPIKTEFKVRPFTIKLSPYNNMSEVYDYRNSNNKIVASVSEETLNLQEENRETPCRPIDSLTLFATRNPDTGKVNLPVSPFNTYPSVGGLGSVPGGGVVEIETTVITGKDETTGEPIYETITIKRENLFAEFPIWSNPGVHRAYIWSVKLWDREKLVRHMIPVSKGQRIYDSYVAPSDCMFDSVTETFFTNQNKGGSYTSEYDGLTYEVLSSDVLPLVVSDDPSTYGKITVNYYKDGNVFIGNKKVDVPCIYDPANTSYSEIFHLNDMNPDERYYHDGRSDYGGLWRPEGDFDPTKLPSLEEIHALGYINVFYDQKMFEQTASYYIEDKFVGYAGFRFTVKDLERATNIEELGINLDVFADERFSRGRAIFDNAAVNDTLRYDEVIDLPTIPVIMEKKPNNRYFYLEYFRDSANESYTRDFSKNYVDCSVPYKVVLVEGIDGLNRHNPELGTIVKHYSYKEEVLITKTTSDKTWGYDAVANCWLELKNLTTKRESKYLKALALDVIDLDEFVWNDETIYRSFADLNVDIQHWNLSYHGDAENPYTGAYTKEALLAKEKVDVVYPQLPYNYNCLYYRDILLSDSKPIKVKPFSFTIGDFDINWQNFIDTNERYLKSTYIKITKDTIGRKEPGVQFEAVKDLLKDNWYYTIRLSDDRKWYYVLDELDWTYFWVSVEDTEIYIPTPSLDGIGKTWADLGIIKNEFKPVDCADGIMIWNLYQFQNAEEQIIDLKSLIVSGGQKILYPIKTGDYKALYTHSLTKFTHSAVSVEDDLSYLIRAEHLTSSQNVAGSKVGNWLWGDTDPIDLGFVNGQVVSPRGPKLTFTDNPTWTSQPDYHPSAGRRPFNSKLSFSVFVNGYKGSVGGSGYDPRPAFRNINRVDYVQGEATSFDYDYFAKGSGRIAFVKHGKDGSNQTVIATRVSGDKLITFNPNLYHKEEFKIKNTVYPFSLRWSTSSKFAWIGSGICDGGREVWDGNRVLLKRFRVFNQNKLIADYIPLPKGHPIANGRMPQTGFYDLITGVITTQYEHTEKTYLSSTINGSYKVLRDDYTLLQNGKYTSYPVLYHQTADVEKDKPLDYFGEQNYDTEAVFYPAKTTANVTSYEYPDEYSNEKHKYPIGQVVPVVRILRNQEWSYVGSGWIKSSYLSREVSYPIAEPTYNKVAIKGDVGSQASSWALKLEPKADSLVNNNVAKYESVVPVAAISGEFLWVDNGWLDYRGTDLHFNTINMNLITSDSVNCYELPTVQSKLIKTYVLGSQITATKALIRDPEWVHTGEGWIYKKNKTVEIRQ